jgi:hypothetical protein
MAGSSPLDQMITQSGLGCYGRTGDISVRDFSGQAIDFRAGGRFWGGSILGQVVGFGAGVSILPSFVWRPSPKPSQDFVPNSLYVDPHFRKTSTTTSNIRHLQLSNACLRIGMETRSAKQSSLFLACLISRRNCDGNEDEDQDNDEEMGIMWEESIPPQHWMTPSFQLLASLESAAECDRQDVV